MQTILDEFLNAEKEEIRDIVQKLKNNKHSRLEISLRHPYSHKVITPNKWENYSLAYFSLSSE